MYLPSLTFGAATTDRIDCGSASMLDNMDPIAVLCWVRLTALTGSGVFAQKTDTGSFSLRLTGTAGNIEILRSRTSLTDYKTNDTPLAATGLWKFVAGVFSSAATQPGAVYVGSMASPAVESTYGTATAGSGSLTTDAGGNLVLGNRSGADTPLLGSVSAMAVVNQALTLADIRQWQRWTLDPTWRPGPRWQTRVFLRPGLRGAGNAVDLSGSGNTGTVTGATPAPGPTARPKARRGGGSVISASTYIQPPIAAYVQNAIVGGGVF